MLLQAYRPSVWSLCACPAAHCAHLHNLQREKRARKKIIYASCFLIVCTYVFLSMALKKRKKKKHRWDAIWVGNIRSATASLSQDTSLNWTRAMTERKQNNSKDFTIERILGVDKRLNDGKNISRPPDIKDVELSVVSSSSSSNSSSCENDEEEEDLSGNSSSANFPETTASSWLQNSYGVPPFFNRGWFNQAIRPPFFTLQGEDFL